MNVVTFVHEDSVVVASRQPDGKWAVQIVSMDFNEPSTSVWTNDELLDYLKSIL